ncbi:hypothetical protein TNCV_606651 [Trichonephila clavipes]|nr:hypothetical protein TNCV_606651 [Trichonephila clavipes]
MATSDDRHVCSSWNSSPMPVNGRLSLSVAFSTIQKAKDTLIDKERAFTTKNQPNINESRSSEAGYGMFHELVACVVVSWDGVLMPLKTCSVEQLMHVKSIETHIGVVWKFGE